MGFEYFKLNDEEKVDLLAEINRYLFHICLVYVFTQILEGNYYIFDMHVFKTLICALLAILSYNFIFKKYIIKKLKKINKYI